MDRIERVALLAGWAGLALLAQPPAQPPGQPPHGMPGGPRFSFMGFGPGMSATVTGAPYSAVQMTQFIQKLPDGNTIQRSEQTNIFRDTQGRVRVEHTLAGRAPAVSIFDPVAGYNYVLEAGSQKAVQSAVRQRPAGDPEARGPRPGGRRTRAEEAVQTENLGAQTINGVVATGTRNTQTIPAGAIGNAQPIQIVREVWISQELKVPVMIKTSDPRFGETTTQLTKIVQANPDAALFQVPAGYTVETGRGGRMWPSGKGPGR